MKTRSLVGIGLILLLLNALNIGFVITPVIAYVNMKEDISEKLEECGSDISKDDLRFDKKFSEKTSSTYVAEDGWNFNYTNQWSEFAYVEGNVTRLVIGLSNANPDGYNSLKKLTIQNSGKIVNSVSIKGKVVAVVVEIPFNVMSSFVADVRATGLASYIEPNMKFQMNIIPNDLYWSLQWGPQRIEVDWAWNTTIGDPSVLVAVVDTGIDWDHPDLAANYVPLGYDWVNNDENPMDDHGHGTHCAGIIAAVINNGIGIAGLAQVRIMAEKGLDQWGSGYEDWLANAIIDAVDKGADIISMSWGGYFHSELIYEAIKYAYDLGVLLVAAAGNDGTSTKMFPAGYDEVIAVAATDRYDGRPWWTNYGEWIELAAPGVDIYSTVWNDGYTYMSGTSMACPHVAGLAALVWSSFPEKTRDWVRLWLRFTADDLGDPGFDIRYGYGRINARKAVEQVPPEHELIILNWETPSYVKPSFSGIINATILNFGGNDENDIEVQLLANGTIADSKFIDFLGSGALVTVSCSWSPVIEGLYNITMYVVPVPDETIVENNVISKYIYVGFPVKAVVLDSAGTDIGQVITTWQVLNINWHLFGSTLIYIDYTTLNKENISYEDLVATEADVLIISCAYDPYAGWQFTDSEVEAIKRYVFEGHGLIATAGTFYYYVPNNNKLASLFGLSESMICYSTGTDLLHIQEPTHPLFLKVPNPLVFPQVGTAVPSDGLWDSNELVDGKYLALGHYKESAIVVRRGLVYISPWLEIIPAYYHHHLQLLYNAIIWSRYEKPEHELTASLEAPTRLKPGEYTLLNATVSNKGRSDERNVELQLFIDGIVVDSVTISELPIDSSYTLSYSWASNIQTIHNVTAYALPLAEEEFTENNVATKMVMVLLIVVEKVLIYTDDAYVTPSSRYPIVALNNLGINYTHYADNPLEFGAALVSQPWDLVIVDHCNYYALGNFWTELEAYVLNGGFLILSTFDIDGSNSEPTTLWNTLGAQWSLDMPYPEPVYRWMATHPIFTFPNNVGNLTLFVEGYWDDGDHVKATTSTAVAGFTTSPTEGYAGIVVGNEYQTVLFSFLLDEFRYDQDVDGKLDAVELWENAIVYLSKPIEHDLSVTLDAPKFLKPEDSSLISATVKNRGSNNETDVELYLYINGTLVNSTSIPLLSSGASQTIRYLWTPTVEGTYNITAYAPPVLGENVTGNNLKSKFVEVFVMVIAVVLDSFGTDYADHCFWDYLVANWANYGETRIVIDYTSLNKEDITLEDIQTTHADVLIISDAWSDTYAYGWEFSDSEIEAIKAYVLEGHGIIATSGTFDAWSAPNNVKLAELFGMDPTIQYQWGFNGEQKITNGIFNLLMPRHMELWYNILDPYLSGELVTLNPIPSSDWAVQGVITGWIEALSTDHYAAVITNEEVHRAVYFTCMLEGEGQYNENNRQLFYNAILWAVQRPEHEVMVSLDTPLFLEPEESTLLNATVYNSGLNNETNVELQLIINGTIADFTIIPELLTGESFTLSYLWTPIFEGTYNVTAYALPVPDEEYTWNNVISKFVKVQIFPDILIVADDDAFSWIRGTSLPEFELALTAAGYEYWIWEESTMGRPSLEYLTKFKLVIWSCGDFWNWAVDPIDAQTLETYLAQGGNILLEGEDIGYNHHADQFMVKVAHATYQVDDTGAPGLTVTDPTHPVTQGLPTTFLWLTNPPYDDGVTPTNEGFEVICYTGTSWTAVTVFDGTEMDYGSVVYYAFPIYCLEQNERDTLIINSVIWLSGSPYEHDIAITDVMPSVNEVREGETVDIDVDVENQGNSTETFTVTAYAVFQGNSTTTLAQATSLTTTYVKVLNPLTGDSNFMFPHTIPIGHKFTVNITVTDVELLAGWQVNFTFDPTLLTIADPADVYLPSDHVFAGLDPRTVDPVINNSAGYVLWTCVIGPNAPVNNFNGSGRMMCVELTVIKTPTSSESFSCNLVLDRLDLPWTFPTMLVNPDTEEIPFTERNGYYQIGGITPPPYYTIGTVTVSDLAPGETRTLTFTWNTTNVPPGNYLIYAEAPRVLYEKDIEDNKFYDGIITVLSTAVHDVAVADIAVFPNEVYQGRIVSINVTVSNLGNVTETFAVTVYYDDTIITTQNVYNLEPNTTLTLNFLWNTTSISPSNYTIKAEASTVAGEINTDNNILIDGWIKIKFMGDINGDDKVDIKDLVLLIKSFGSHPTHPRWDPNADLNGDNKVDIKDLIMLIKNFEK